MARKPPGWQVQVRRAVLCNSKGETVQAGDLVVKLVEEGAEEHNGVVLGTDLCKAPALAHGHVGIRCIIPQPCIVSQPCWGAPACIWGGACECGGEGGGGWGWLLLFQTGGCCSRQGRPVCGVCGRGWGGGGGVEARLLTCAEGAVPHSGLILPCQVGKLVTYSSCVICLCPDTRVTCYHLFSQCTLPP